MGYGAQPRAWSTCRGMGCGIGDGAGAGCGDRMREGCGWIDMMG